MTDKENALREEFLRRLARMVDLREKIMFRLHEHGRNFMNMSVYSSYVDCCRLGAREEADRIISGESRTSTCATR